MNYNRRTDHNETELVAYLRALGYKVKRMYFVGGGFPDLLVGGEMPCPYCGKLFWQDKVVEVKQPGKSLEQNQSDWWEEWNHDPRVAHTTEELDRIVGRERQAGIRNGENASINSQDNQQARGAQVGSEQARVPDTGGTHPVSQNHRSRSHNHTGKSTAHEVATHLD